MQKGGYIIISINDIDIYNKLQIAMKINKPILFYEDTDVCYFIDTISGGEVTSEIIDDEEVFTYHDIIMKKGSKTFTITSANAVSSEGEIQLTPDNFYPLLENIKDASGNLRFIEGTGEPVTKEGLIVNYIKWSLSGTHLMFVISGKLDDTTIVSANEVLVDFTDVPKWITDKIDKLFRNFIDVKQFNIYIDDFGTWNSQSMSIALYKNTDDSISIRNLNNITMNSDKNFRFQFDLLIDNESEE